MKKYFCIKEYCIRSNEIWYYYVEYNTRIRKHVFHRFEEVINCDLNQHLYRFSLVDTGLSEEEVDSRRNLWSQQCPDYTQRHNYCKHIVNEGHLRSFCIYQEITNEGLRNWRYLKLVDFVWSDVKLWIDEI